MDSLFDCLAEVCAAHRREGDGLFLGPIFSALQVPERHTACVAGLVAGGFVCPFFQVS